MENIEEMGSEHTELKPKLYLVPTPLGNLGDITLRAKAVLEDVSEVYCEDTRNSLKLMNALGIKNTLAESLYDLNTYLLWDYMDFTDDKKAFEQYKRKMDELAEKEILKEERKKEREAKKLAKYINRQGRKIDRITKLQRKVMCY